MYRYFTIYTQYIYMYRRNYCLYIYIHTIVCMYISEILYICIKLCMICTYIYMYKTMYDIYILPICMYIYIYMINVYIYIYIYIHRIIMYIH